MAGLFVSPPSCEPSSSPNPFEAKEASPTKTTAVKRARKIITSLVLWIVVPALLLSIILLTIKTHDLEEEDCQEDSPVNCPLDCSQGYKKVRCPPVCPKDLSNGFRCRRSISLYLVPFLGIKLIYVGTFLYVYLVVLFVSLFAGEKYEDKYIPRVGPGAIYWMAKERRQEIERKQRERDEMQLNGEAPPITLATNPAFANSAP